jgi:hypothetical protein
MRLTTLHASLLFNRSSIAFFHKDRNTVDYRQLPNSTYEKSKDKRQSPESQAGLFISLTFVCGLSAPNNEKEVFRARLFISRFSAGQSPAPFF